MDGEPAMKKPFRLFAWIASIYIFFHLLLLRGQNSRIETQSWIATDSSQMTTRDITILLLRHGERADEAVRKNGGSLGPRSTKERMDPALTELGHEQATEAFGHIVPFLEKKNAAIFVSPLRRTMATAAMIGMHESVNIAERDIPLIVMNGLSDCAAHVKHAGGAYRAVRDGYIDGAVMDSNDGSKDSPLMKMLAQMPMLQKLKRPIQYHKVDDSCDLIPISEPINGDSSVARAATHGEDVTPTSALPLAHSPSTTSCSVGTSNDDSFTSTIKRVTRIAAIRGLDTAIVVTHREGIRALANDISRTYQRFRTPYCCIGKFAVRVDNDGIDVGWRFDGVVPYEEF